LYVLIFGDAPAFPFFLAETARQGVSIRSNMTYSRTLLRTALVVLALVSAGLCQAAPRAPKAKPASPLLVYTGDWSATFDGRVWLRLQLEMLGDAMKGSVVRARKIEVNDSGELKAVSEELATEKVTAAEVNPDGLLLQVADTETQETNRYLMKLVAPGNDSATIKLLAMAMPPGMPKPRPWIVKKADAAPEQK